MCCRPSIGYLSRQTNNGNRKRRSRKLRLAYQHQPYTNRRWNFQTEYCQLRLWYLRYWRSTTAKHGHRLEKLSTHICTTTKRTIRCIEPYESLRGRLATIAKKHIPSKAKQIRQQLYYYIATIRTTTLQQTGRNYIARTTSQSGRRYR